MSTAAPIQRVTGVAAHSARVFDNLVTLCLLTASLAYCAADARPDLAVFTVAAAGVGWVMRRGALARGAAPPNLPGVLVNVLVLVAIARAAWHVLRGQSTGNAVVSDLSEFLIIIQLVKLFDRKTARDDVQLLALTLFVAIGAILTANSLLVGALIFVYTPLITSAAMALQIDIGLRRLRAPGGAVRDPADGPGRAGHFRTTVAVAVAGSLVFAGLAFVLLPRGLGRNTLGAFGRVSPGAAVGFTDQIRLGQQGFLNPNDATPVLDVAVFDSEGRNVGQQMRSLLLRGSVSNTYDPVSRTWHQLSTPAATGGRDGGVFGVPEPEAPLTTGVYGTEPGTAEFKQVITLRSAARAQKYLFMLWRPSRVEWDSPGVLNLQPQTLVFRRSRAAGQFRYTAWSAREGVVAEDLPTFVPDVFAGGEIRVLAAGLLEENRLPVEHASRGFAENRAAAATFQAYLRENATYTLQMEAPPPGVDPIDHFVFERRQGHCEYFASALVAMCQSVGIPARLALGYLATEYNEVSGQFMVRASNAHAWAEVQIEPGRWVVFDPSPPADIAQLHAPATGVLARLRRAYDAMDFAWNSLVVSFDEQRRSSILSSGVDLSSLRERLSAFADGVDERMKELAGSVTGDSVRSAWWTYVVLGVLVAALVGTLARRRLAWLFAGGGRGGVGGSDPLAIDLHRRLLRALRRARAPKPAPRPVLAHAESIGASHPELARAAEGVAEAVYGSRFGGVAVTRERWRTLCRELDAAASQAVPGAPSLPTRT